MTEQKKKPRCPDCHKILYIYTVTIKRKLQGVRKDKARFCATCKKDVKMENAVIKHEIKRETKIISTYEVLK